MRKATRLQTSNWWRRAASPCACPNSAAAPWWCISTPRTTRPAAPAEGQDFRDLYPRFRRRRTVVFGISRDTLKTHENFKSKHKFPFQLLSDPDEVACKRYDVIKMKNMYGRKVRGIERSTFLIDPEGVVRRVWRKVRVSEHAAEVLAAVADLSKA